MDSAVSQDRVEHTQLLPKPVILFWRYMSYIYRDKRQTYYELYSWQLLSYLSPRTRAKMTFDLKQAYVRHNGRLALYQRSGSSVSFWEENWSKISTEQLRHVLRPTKRLSVHRFFLNRWLPRDGVILEAGCGTSLWVVRLRQNGFNCVGIDNDTDSLRRSKEICKDLPIMCGDVRSMPFADGSMAGYLSFGVVEHFREGPGCVLRECRRVLRDGGVALISVPFENRFRRNLPTISETEALTKGLQFYQYYFTLDDFNKELNLAGLRPTNVFHGYAVNGGFDGSAVFLKSIARRLGRFSVLLDLMPGLPRLAAHMMFTVAVKISKDLR